MKQGELISVIIPVYNAEKYLSECLDSVLTQTYAHLEVVIINDGSTDHSLDILKKIDDPRIKITTILNGGVSNARNLGLKQSTGKYILFVDADDVIDANTIQTLYGKIKEYKVDIIRYNGYVQDQQGRLQTLEFPLPDHTTYQSSFHSRELIDLLNDPKSSIRCYSPLLFMKNVNIVPFHTELSYLEDKVFYMENFLNHKRILFLDCPFYYYKYNENSKTKNTSKFVQNLKDILDSKKYIVEIASANGYYEVEKIDASYGNLLLYRLDYFLAQVKYREAKSVLEKVLRDQTIKNSFLFSANYLNRYKKIQLYLLNKKRVRLYYFLTKGKGYLKRK